MPEIDQIPARILILWIIIMTFIGGVGWYGYQNVGFWLAQNDDLQKAEVVVCLGGPERDRKAAELYHQGYSQDLIVTAEKTKDNLTKLKVPGAAITLAPWPKTTYQEALAVAPLIKEKGYHTALVITDPFHIRRVRWTFTHVFEKQPVQFEFVSSDLPFIRDRWWKNKMSRFYVLSEVSKITYYRVVHGLLGIKQEPPWVMDLKHRYEHQLRAWCLAGA